MHEKEETRERKGSEKLVRKRKHENERKISERGGNKDAEEW